MIEEKVKYYLDEKSRFVIENYNWAEPFSNFFPGIGGKWGIPLWLYYVNRAQCISSMGIRDKDNAIMEFFPFNKACQLASNQGFRTFLKIDDEFLYEPFRQTKEKEITQTMKISTGELKLSDHNNSLGIRVNIEYFPLVNLPVAGLVRKVSIKNQGKKSLKLEIIDGLPHILPFGMNQHCIKFIARHIEAMMRVDTIDGTPFFRLKQVPLDIPHVQKIEGGNFYFTFQPDQNAFLKDNYAIDPSLIFGISGGFETPWMFANNSVEKILTFKQMNENKTPCAFTLMHQKIDKGQEIIFYSFIGNSSSEEKLRDFKQKVLNENFVIKKREENKKIIDEIENNILTVSSDKNFDGYCDQTFLDNVMRGGLPAVFKTNETKNIFYLYSRKHGDIERDYNHFVLEQTYLSQGNSHFRDVNQNRRNDVWFNPEIEDRNIIMFFNLIQTDGFNPLVVNGLTYRVENLSSFKKWLGDFVKDPSVFSDLLGSVSRPFTPGEFIMKIEEAGIALSLNYDEVIAQLLSFCKQNDVGQPSEGFWIDHWTYNLDLLDNFLMVYPDRLKEILIDKEVYTFFDNPDVVLPRNRKYILEDGKVRQYEAVVRDKEKIKLIQTRNTDPYKVRTEYGKGKVYTTNLLVKILSLIANKISSLDPEGIGIEMEADKPGWYDPLNGLPGLMTSSLCETLELKRTCSFLLTAISKTDIDDRDSVCLFEEMHIFILELMEALKKRLNSEDKDKAFVFWDDSHKIKEFYREKTKFGVSGKEFDLKLSMHTVKKFLLKCLKLLDEIFSDLYKEKVFHENGVCFTYFLNQVKRYDEIYLDDEKKERSLNNKGLQFVTPKEFKQKPLSLFLEGPVHLLKIKKDLARKIYNNVKKSGIYDNKLKMYKTSESIASESFEIGRARAYLPGWIENESIYLHMEYKYLLELLNAGLYEEYYDEIKNTLIPFFNPETYGRSILENSSFIVSSAFPDKELHGRGFQPRLSGATAEFLTMWIIMVAGQKPFFIDETNSLKFMLDPILPGWLFTEEEQICTIYTNNKPMEHRVPVNSFAFKFLGKTLVVYHNEKRKNTYGKDGMKIVSYTLKYVDGKTCELRGNVLDSTITKDLRNGQVERIDALLQ